MNAKNQLDSHQKSWGKAVFVTWDANCMRSRNQSIHLGAELLIVCPVRSFRTLIGTLVRYLLAFPMTIAKLCLRRPDVIFTQNQPIFLVVAVAAYAKLTRTPYVIDSHSGAFNDPRWKWSLPIYEIMTRHALINLNTNDHHKNIVETWGGRSILIPDVPIHIDSITFPEESLPPYAAVVTSFSFDEPIDEIFVAARRVPDVRFYLTGNYSKLDDQQIQTKPINVKFTGFVSYSEYLGLLQKAICVIVLTTRDHTMQRGAYEALSLGAPIITSDFKILRDCFADASLYVDNQPEAIAAAVLEIRDHQSKFRTAARKQRDVRRNYYENVMLKISDLVADAQN